MTALGVVLLDLTTIKRKTGLEQTYTANGVDCR